MTGFFEKAKATQASNENVAITENGAIGYRSTGKALLDLNFSIPQMRNQTEEEIQTKWAEAYAENPELAMRWLFYVRDVRCGIGERRLFRVIMRWMAQNHTTVVSKLIGTADRYTTVNDDGELIPFYGRWDDLLDLTDTMVGYRVYRVIGRQLGSDVYRMNQGLPVSLMAKWLPTLTSSSKDTRKKARKLCKKIGVLETPYRQNVSALRRYLEVTEVKMTNQEWDTINYESVPGRASMRYKDAFMKHDPERYSQYIQDVASGKKKINSNTLYPHEIVHAMKNSNNNKNDLYEGMWNNLSRDKSLNNTIVVRDGSGSMTRSAGNSSVTALDVADALSIYFAELLSGEFHNKVITFSRSPKFIELDNSSTLREKLRVLARNTEVANTNIEAVFDLILQTAVTHRMSQNEIPKNILIISDMEFDHCVEDNSDRHPSLNRLSTLFSVIADKYDQFGYKLPRVIFWNVNSRTGTIPMTENELGVVLMSGFSTNAINQVMSGKTDPYECLVDTLMIPRYDPIAHALGYPIKEI